MQVVDLSDPGRARLAGGMAALETTRSAAAGDGIIVTADGATGVTVYAAPCASAAAAVVHAVLSCQDMERSQIAPRDKLIVTNTIPLEEKRAECDKIVELSVARLLGQAIRSIHEETSVSSLFV